MSVVSGPSNGSRPDYVDAVTGARVAERLEGFDWRVVGTPPLGIALASSDIDIVCHTPSYGRFADVLWRSFSECANFSLRQRAQGLKTEPAFAKVLGLRGDPFFAMEALFESDGEHLRQLIDDSKIDAVSK